MATTTVYAGLYAYLSTVGAVTALVGSTGADEPRIRPMRTLKQNETLPALAIYRVAARRWPTFGSETYGHVGAIVQIDAYAETVADALALADAVREALEGWSGGSVAPRIRGTLLNTEQDWYEEESETFRVLQQWTIHHSE